MYQGAVHQHARKLEPYVAAAGPTMIFGFSFNKRTGRSSAIEVNFHVDIAGATISPILGRGTLSSSVVFRLHFSLEISLEFH